MNEGTVRRASYSSRLEVGMPGPISLSLLYPPDHADDSGSFAGSGRFPVFATCPVLLIVKILYAVHDFTTDFVARC